MDPMKLAKLTARDNGAEEANGAICTIIMELMKRMKLKDKGVNEDYGGDEDDKVDGDGAIKFILDGVDGLYF